MICCVADCHGLDHDRSSDGLWTRLDVTTGVWKSEGGQTPIGDPDRPILSKCKRLDYNNYYRLARAQNRQEQSFERCETFWKSWCSPLLCFFLASEPAPSCAYCPYERQGPGGTVNAVHGDGVRAGIRHIGELAGRMDGYRGRR